uniref:Uncharacterized protein n=1 Tax=Anguilla anguilla TaxID=7936 RepID=A0A0E9UG72_ANGAN
MSADSKRFHFQVVLNTDSAPLPNNRSYSG